MTPNLVPLYFFSVAAISLLGLFARRNKRTGWVKPRVTFVDDLRALQADWERTEEKPASAGSPTPAANGLPPATSVDKAVAFTVQLAQLDGALSSGAPKVSVEAPVAIPESASK